MESHRSEVIDSFIKTNLLGTYSMPDNVLGAGKAAENIIGSIPALMRHTVRRRVWKSFSIKIQINNADCAEQIVFDTTVQFCHYGAEEAINYA